jgi:hypothetical protein
VSGRAVLVVDAVVFLASLEVEQAERVRDDDQRGAFVDENDGADASPRKVARMRNATIARLAMRFCRMIRLVARLSRTAKRRPRSSLISDITGLQRDGGAGGAHRDADIGACHRRGVVDAVADHRNGAVGFGGG